MAGTVDNINSFVDNLRLIDSALSPNLYGFLLFDERPSHEPIERFAAKEFDWLDDLARSSQIILFVYVAKAKGRAAKRARIFEVKSGDQIKRERVILVQSRSEIKNPSLEVARELGIEPKQLPGIAFFQGYPKDDKKGIYFSLEAQLFENNSEIERVFSEIFGLIQRCQQVSSSAGELYEKVREELRRMKRDERLRPVRAYLKTSLVRVIALPTTLIGVAGKSFVEAFAEAMAKQLTGP